MKSTESIDRLIDNKPFVFLNNHTNLATRDEIEIGFKTSYNLSVISNLAQLKHNI